MASLAAIADLLPGPGEWSEAEFCLVSERGRLVELSDGNIEIPPRPADTHQLLLMRLSFALHAYVVAHRLSEVRFAPHPVRLWEGKIREPDFMFMSAAHAGRIGKYWGVPDLVGEIVSPGGEITDRRIKRAEYAQAGIPEYWIVEPEAKTIELLRLLEDPSASRAYGAGRIFTATEMLVSPTLPGFSLALAELFAPE